MNKATQNDADIDFHQIKIKIKAIENDDLIVEWHQVFQHAIAGEKVCCYS